ncbi:MAG TPA: hypothetical protein PK299_00605 [Anaerolineales bacterium]|nr:hypothetical protein [Anaerolineales bacterium]
MFAHPSYFSICGIPENCAFSLGKNGAILKQVADTWQFANLSNMQSKLGFALMRPSLAGLPCMKGLSAMVVV